MERQIREIRERNEETPFFSMLLAIFFLYAYAGTSSHVLFVELSDRRPDKMTVVNTTMMMRTKVMI